jgi:hypothetical protein
MSNELKDIIRKIRAKKKSKINDFIMFTVFLEKYYFPVSFIKLFLEDLSDLNKLDRVREKALLSYLAMIYQEKVKQKNSKIPKKSVAVNYLILFIILSLLIIISSIFFLKKTIYFKTSLENQNIQEIFNLKAEGIYSNFEGVQYNPDGIKAIILPIDIYNNRYCIHNITADLQYLEFLEKTNLITTLSICNTNNTNITLKNCQAYSSGLVQIFQGDYSGYYAVTDLLQNLTTNSSGIYGVLNGDRVIYLIPKCKDNELYNIYYRAGEAKLGYNIYFIPSYSNRISFSIQKGNSYIMNIYLAKESQDFVNNIKTYFNQGNTAREKNWVVISDATFNIDSDGKIMCDEIQFLDKKYKGSAHIYNYFEGKSSFECSGKSIRKGNFYPFLDNKEYLNSLINYLFE